MIHIIAMARAIAFITIGVRKHHRRDWHPGKVRSAHSRDMQDIQSLS